MKILVADSNGLFLTRVRMFFDQFGNNVTVITATNGFEAMNLIRKHIDLTLAFINPDLPTISGLEVLRHIKITCPDVEKWMMVTTVFPQLTEETAQMVGAQVITQDGLGQLLMDRKILNIPVH